MSRRESLLLSPTFLNDSLNDAVSYSYSVKDSEHDFFPIPEAIELELYLESQDNFSLSDSIKCFENESDHSLISPDFLHESVDILQQGERLVYEYQQSPADKIEDYLSLSKEKDIEMKLGMLEGKIEEESSKIQHNQDTIIRNILVRKNSEVADMKTYYQNKVIELEAIIKTRDQDAATMTAKAKELRRLHNQEIMRLQNAIQGNECCKMDEHEKEICKLEHKISNMEKLHKEKIVRIIEENNVSMLNLKRNFSNENKDLISTIAILKEKLGTVNKLKDKIMWERDVCRNKEDDLLNQITQLQSEVLEKNKRNSYLEKVKKELILEHETVVSDIRQKSQQEFDNVKKEQVASASKTSSKIAEMESKIFYYRQALQDLKMSKQQEIKEQKLSYEKKLDDLESSSNKKIKNLMNELNRKESMHSEKLSEIESSLYEKMQKLQSESETKDSQYKGTIRKYELEFKEKEDAICKLETKIIEQTMDAEAAIKHLQKQTEKELSRTSRELNDKLQQLQLSLNSARDKIIKQKNELGSQLEEQKNKYEMQRARYKSHFELVHLKLQEKYDKEMTECAEKFSRQRLDYEEKMKGLLPLSIKVELEDTIQSMRQQVLMLQSQVDVLQEELQDLGSFHHSRRSNILDS